MYSVADALALLFPPFGQTVDPLLLAPLILRKSSRPT